MSKPFFSKSMLRTDPNGNYEAFSGADRVSAYEDRIQIGKLQIPYSDLIELRLFDNVLHIVFATPDGRRNERYFKYDSFLPGRDRKLLNELLSRVTAIMEANPAARHAGAASPQPSATASQPSNKGILPAPKVASIAEPLRGAEPMGETRGRHSVGVFSSIISFPPICPTCCAPAETIMTIPRPSGTMSMESSNWLVPVCDQHRHKTAAIYAQQRKSPADPWVFSFADPSYASDFLDLNDTPIESRESPDALDSPLYKKLESGVRYVAFQYAIGMIYVSLSQTSPVYEIKPNGGTLLRSLPYSFLSLLLGWWSFPVGPIFTISALVRNTRGGIDLTEAVRATMLGK